MAAYTRHPGSPAASHPQTRAAARSTPAVERTGIATAQCVRSSHARATAKWARIGHARTLLAPLHPPRARTRFVPLYRPPGRRSALGRSAQWHALAITQPPHTGARRPAHGTSFIPRSRASHGTVRGGGVQRRPPRSNPRASPPPSRRCPPRPPTASREGVRRGTSWSCGTRRSVLAPHAAVHKQLSPDTPRRRARRSGRATAAQSRAGVRARSISPPQGRGEGCGGEGGGTGGGVGGRC